MTCPKKIVKTAEVSEELDVPEKKRSFISAMFANIIGSVPFAIAGEAVSPLDIIEPYSDAKPFAPGSLKVQQYITSKH